ncbi:MAG: hypothetical protein KGL34_11195 [Gammaproteobacteria bacterium]|nr:hypothetical protein [Gammaproteobacteria bacterium]
MLTTAGAAALAPDANAMPNAQAASHAHGEASVTTDRKRTPARALKEANM